MQIREIDPANVSYCQASRITELLLHAFQKDEFYEAMLGPRYFKSLSPPVGSAWNYRKLHFSRTLKLWAKLKSNDTRNYEVINDNNEIIGYCSWTIPPSLRVETPRWRSVSSWVINKLSAFVDKILFLGEGNLSPPNRMAKLEPVFDEINEDLGWLNIKGEDLAYLDLDSLTKTLYHPDSMWWCNMLGVDPKYQGQGYGKALLSHCLKEIKPLSPTFKDGEAEITGPAKYGLYSSTQARRLYESQGFVLTREITKEFDGHKFGLPVFLKTVF